MSRLRAAVVPVALAGMIVIEAEDGPQFAGAWDGVRGW